MFDDSWTPRGTGYVEHAQHYPQPGWVEHDPIDVWTKLKESVAMALKAADIAPREVRAIGLANQGETCLAWDRRTGQPVYNAIVWQDRRTAKQSDALRERYGAMIQQRTGVRVDAYFSALKLNWILDHVEGARSLAEQGELQLGTLDTWLLWKMTAGNAYLTDPSTASRTMLFNLLNTGNQPVPSANGLVTTLVWSIDGKATYALDGGVYTTGAAIQWLRDGLQIIESAADTEAAARSVPDTGGVYFVPAFAGLAAPHWDQYARGTIVGLTGGTTKAQLIRATLEATAFQVAENLDVMKKDYGAPIDCMRVDGGAVVNEFLMQFQADLLGIPIEVPENHETTVLGAALLAALGIGDLDGLEAIADVWKLFRRYEPSISEDCRQSLSAQWQRAVQRSRNWAKSD